ncbi:MAG: hypothetical protein SCJ97_04260 [Bacillota bacterium]|nr:hypothetical protein [Bacillota bacterium]
MTYQVNKTITNIVSGAAVLIAYCVYAFGRYQAGLLAADDLRAWAITMLVFIGIGVAAAIVIQIAFHILFSIAIAIRENLKNGTVDDKEVEKTIELEMVEDEMDKLIELKSLRVGFIVAGIGFVAALISLVLYHPPVVMINILFLSFSIGSLLEGFTQLYFYRKGVTNV